MPNEQEINTPGCLGVPDHRHGGHGNGGRRQELALGGQRSRRPSRGFRSHVREQVMDTKHGMCAVEDGGPVRVGVGTVGLCPAGWVLGAVLTVWTSPPSLMRCRLTPSPDVP